MVEITDPIREMILNRRAEATIRGEAARYGYRPLFEAGIELATSGVTTIDEVLKVTSPLICQDSPAAPALAVT